MGFFSQGALSVIPHCVDMSRSYQISNALGMSFQFHHP